MPSIDGAIAACEGDIRWMAPERVMGSGRVTVEGDVWAFGMTILVCLCHSGFPYFHTNKVAQELFTGKPPFSDPTGMMQLVVRVTKGPLPVQPDHMPDDWWDLCLSCWQRQPTSRPTMSTLVQQIEEVGVLIWQCDSLVNSCSR